MKIICVQIQLFKLKKKIDFWLELTLIQINN